MLIDTPQKMERRKAELEKPEIDRLMKKAKGDRYNTATMILASKFGIEGDNSPTDYGEPQ